MAKRKASSEVSKVNEEWDTIIKILEKPGVSNRLLEYLCFLNISVTDKQATHRKWVEVLNDILKNHPTSRIQKLADKSVKNYQYEVKSQAVTKFWTHIEKSKIGNKLFLMHFNGVAELVENRNNYLDSGYDELQGIHVRDNLESEYNEPQNTQVNDEEEYFAHIIDLDNATELDKPHFCTVEEWSNTISELQSPSTKLPKSVEEQLDCYLEGMNIKKIRELFESYKKVTSEEDIYTRKVMDHFIFCLENRAEYFAQRPSTESTFRARFIEPIIDPFVFIFKNMDGEVSSLSSAARRNFHLEEGKRRRIGSKGDGIGTLVNLDDKELLVIEISGAPTRLPKRHSEGDKVKLERCLVDVLNNHLEEYKLCDFNLAKKLRVFGFQSERYNCSISTIFIVGRGLYCKKTLFQFTLPIRELDLCYMYDIIGVMLSFRNELSKSLSVIQQLKIAKARKLASDDPICGYMLRLPPT